MGLRQEKYQALRDGLTALGSVAVAFSGGVDSTFLLWVAHDVLGDRAVAVTASSSSFPERERREATDFCTKYGISQVICPSSELDIKGFRQNPPNRCYLCKRALLGKICAIAQQQGLNAVIEGSNVDDEGDYRPGMQAVRELGVVSPLRQAGLTKQEIRLLSKELGLPTWDKPSFACLASRFAYGETITEEKLRMVEQAEGLLLELGFRQMRVRIHGTIARIELLPEDFPRLLAEDTRRLVYDRFKSYGFSYVALDLLGYRTGSMNETLSAEDRRQNDA
ncbi:MAG: ATP-dependent sacrificial sulfur transferase LarE [Clostridiales bacterium]|nr:ATP-dependent sacrificial sulfur transferase LarE [Clostridiales bacterium]